jgi:hypothetical protein
MRFLRPAILFVAILALIPSLISCGTSTTINGQWMDSAYEGKTYDDILVIAITEKPAYRRIFEGAMAEELRKLGVDAVPSSSVLPGDRQLSEDDVRPILDSGKVNAVLVTRLLGVDKSQQYVPGSTYAVPYGYYNNFYGYYSNTYQVVHEPGYMAENTTVSLETNLYDTGDEALVWSGVSETFNPESANDLIDSQVRTLVKTLHSKGLLTGK